MDTYSDLAKSNGAVTFVWADGSVAGADPGIRDRHFVATPIHEPEYQDDNDRDKKLHRG